MRDPDDGQRAVGGTGEGAAGAGGAVGDEGATDDTVGGMPDDQVVETMVHQVGDLLDSWMDQVTELMEQGIDPEPLLAGLAGILRSAADHLDPTVDAARR